MERLKQDRDKYEISMGVVWNEYEVSMDWVWNEYGMSMDVVWAKYNDHTIIYETS